MQADCWSSRAKSGHRFTEALQVTFPCPLWCTRRRERHVLSHQRPRGSDAASHVLMSGGTSALPLRQKAGLPPGVREILERACNSWLKNTEVTDLLVNHRQYGLHVSLEPPVRPPGKSSY